MRHKQEVSNPVIFTAELAKMPTLGFCGFLLGSSRVVCVLWIVQV